MADLGVFKDTLEGVGGLNKGLRESRWRVTMGYLVKSLGKGWYHLLRSYQVWEEGKVKSPTWSYYILF